MKPREIAENEFSSDAIAAQLIDAMAEKNQAIGQFDHILQAKKTYTQWLQEFESVDNEAKLLLRYSREQEVRKQLNLKFQGFPVWFSQYKTEMYKSQQSNEQQHNQSHNKVVNEESALLYKFNPQLKYNVRNVKN